MSLGTRDSEFTPLHGAAFQGQPQMIRLLLEHGADPLDRHVDGFIPFHRACWGNSARHSEAALQLLQACPSCNAVRVFRVRFLQPLKLSNFQIPQAFHPTRNPTRGKKKNCDTPPFPADHDLATARALLGLVGAWKTLEKSGGD